MESDRKKKEVEKKKGKKSERERAVKSEGCGVGLRLCIRPDVTLLKETLTTA